MVTAVVGANWGDEGKGKITDMLADQADIVIRFLEKRKTVNYQGVKRLSFIRRR